MKSATRLTTSQHHYQKKHPQQHSYDEVTYTQQSPNTNPKRLGGFSIRETTNYAWLLHRSQAQGT